MENRVNYFKTIEPDWIARLFQEHIKGSFHGSLGIQILKLEQGHCISYVDIHPGVTNHIGSLHGGFLYTIADTTAGFAAVPLGTGITVTTIDGHMQFLRPTVGVKRIYAEAETTKDGKRIIFADLKIYADDGRLLSTGSFTFSLLDLPNAKMPVFDNTTESRGN